MSINGLTILLMFLILPAPLLSTFAGMPRQAQVLEVDMRNLDWLLYQPFHANQFPYVEVPISVGSCFVLPVAPRIDSSPRLEFIWKLCQAH